MAGKSAAHIHRFGEGSQTSEACVHEVVLQNPGVLWGEMRTLRVMVYVMVTDVHTHTHNKKKQVHNATRQSQALLHALASHCKKARSCDEEG